MAQTEGRLALALQAYRQQHFPSYRAAAGSYDVSHTTLLRRDHGTPLASILSPRTANSLKPKN